jgi:hypothetical protein
MAIRLPRLSVAVTAGALALLSLSSIGAACDSNSASSAPSSTVAPTAVPTLSFFRGTSYSTATPLANP